MIYYGVYHMKKKHNGFHPWINPWTNGWQNMFLGFINMGLSETHEPKKKYVNHS
jgi:hypothetical protein